jgi:membrane protein required for colicin V production
MLIDLVFVVMMALAIFKGYNRGLIVAVFSLLAFIVGLAAAVKLSAVVAGWLGENVNVSKEWLPVVSFALVFIGVVLLVRMGAKMIEKSVQLVMLGWVNRLGGIAFFAILYLIILSIAIFYAEQLGLLKPDVIKASKTYSFVKPWGPKVIDGLGSVIPWFKGLFQELESFFGRVAA